MQSRLSYNGVGMKLLEDRSIVADYAVKAGRRHIVQAQLIDVVARRDWGVPPRAHVPGSILSI